MENNNMNKKRKVVKEEEEEPEEKQMELCCSSGYLSKHLPDDIMTTILLQLPKQSLRRFSTVSKRWRRLISDPYFIRSHRALHPPMLGFYTRSLIHAGNKFIPTAPPPLPPPHHPASDLRVMSVQNIEHHLRTDPEWKKLVKDVVRLRIISGSANAAGFIFFQIIRKITFLDDKMPAFVLYNPVQRRGLFIPRQPAPLDEDVQFVGFIRRHDPCRANVPPRFVVVRVGIRTMTVNAFDTALGRWEQRRVTSCASSFAAADGCSRRQKVHPVSGGVVAHGSVLYWFYYDAHILCYDYHGSHLWLVRLPLERGYYTSSRLTESEGQLFYVVLDEKGLWMWVLHKDRRSWNLVRDFSLAELFSRCPRTLGYVRRHCRVTTHLQVHPLGLDPTDQCILFLWWSSYFVGGDDAAIISVNLGSREVKEVCSNAPLALTEMFPVVVPP